MARRVSNADRIARAAAEAEATAKEKAEKKATRSGAAAPGGTAPRARTRAASARKAAIRLKVVWTVAKPGYEPVKTYPYAEREAADAEAARRGGEYFVRPLKVPMD